MFVPLLFFVFSLIALAFLFALKMRELAGGSHTFVSRLSVKWDPWLATHTSSFKAFLLLLNRKTLGAFTRTTLAWIWIHIIRFFSLFKPVINKIHMLLQGGKKDIDGSKNPASFFLKHMAEHKNGLAKDQKDK
jgi:hypothetical protein